jgi:hypothetical protein
MERMLFPMVYTHEEYLQWGHIHISVSPLDTCWSKGPPVENLSTGDISWQGP